MQVDREKLLQGLKLIKPGISAKERISQSSSVIFSDGHIASYNDQIMVMLPTEADITGAVRAEELTNLLDKLSSENVDISVDNGEVIVKSGRSKAGIRFEEFIKLPINEVLEAQTKIEMQELPDSLLDALKRAKFCAATDMNVSNPLVTGIRVADGTVTALDNYQLIHIFLPEGDAKNLPEFILPASSVDALLRYKLDKIGISDAWAFFSGPDGLLFCVRLVASNYNTYPDIAHLLNVKGKDIFLPEKLLEAINKTNIFTKTNPAESDDHIVKIKIKPGRVMIKGRGVFGWYEESLPAKEYEGDELVIQANSDFLAHILPHVQDAVYADSGALLHFKGDDFSYVFALCRSSDEEW